MVDDKQLTILIAEDDDGHADLIMEGLKDAGLDHPVIRFSDGIAAYNFIFNKNQQGRDEMHNPYFLLLDINLPKLDGIELLREIKNDNRYKKIPVIMLTTTDDPVEVKNCYSLGCNAYITKPVDFSFFAEKLRCLGSFIQIVKV